MLNEKDFYKAFNEVITKKDEVIVLYSSIYNFVFNIKFKSKNIPKKVLVAIYVERSNDLVFV